jgi:hypothetical protein
LGIPDYRPDAIGLTIPQGKEYICTLDQITIPSAHTVWGVVGLEHGLSVALGRHREIPVSPGLRPMCSLVLPWNDALQGDIRVLFFLFQHQLRRAERYTSVHTRKKSCDSFFPNQKLDLRIQAPSECFPLGHISLK